MIVTAGKKLIFGRFRLEIRPHPHNRHEVRLSLFRDGALHEAEPKALKLLQFLADEHPNEEVTQHQIHLALWHNAEDAGGNVQQHIHRLREALGDNPKHPQYIFTLPNGSYIFKAHVVSDGDLGRIDGLLKWSNALFFEKLAETTRHDEDGEDLRVVTVSLSATVQDFSFDDLLRKHVRIRIILMNPENIPLTDARFALRQDGETPDGGRAHIRKQVEQLKRIMLRFPGETLEVRLSDAMPCGFVAHTAAWAIVGLFPVHDSFVKGPLMEVPAHTELWNTLYEDWRLRWDNPAQIIKVN